MNSFSKTLLGIPSKVYDYAYGHVLVILSIFLDHLDLILCIYVDVLYQIVIIQSTWIFHLDAQFSITLQDHPAIPLEKVDIIVITRDIIPATLARGNPSRCTNG